MLILCIEGADAVGKTTQVTMLRDVLKTLGYKVKLEEVPTKGMIKNIIYKMLDNGDAKRYPTTFQLLHFLNRFVWQYTMLPFLMFRYDVVILGRWSLSSMIYGSLEGVSKTLLWFLKSLLLTPNKTFIIEGTQYKRNANDSYEKDEELQNRVRRLYSAVDSKNLIKIKNEGKSRLEVHNEILHHVAEAFNEKKK